MSLHAHDERWQELADQEALGESLTLEERRFLAELDGDEYAAERDVLDGLAALGEAGPATEADLALGASVLDELRRQRPAVSGAAGTGAASRGESSAESGAGGRASWPLALGGGLLMVAAALLLFLILPATPGAGDGPLVVQGELSEIDGSASTYAVGGDVPEDVWLQASITPACMADGEQHRACLGARSQVRRDGRWLELRAGDVEVEGAWSVRTRAGSVRSEVGHYRVQVAPGGEPVTVLVLTGTVMLDTEAGTEKLEAGESRVLGGEALAQVDPARVEEPAPPDEAPSTEIPAPGEDAGTGPDEASDTDGAELEVKTRPKTRTSAADMLARARKLRGESKLRGAANAYRDLIAAWPESPEAHTGAVSLGQVQLERKRHKSALAAFDRYLGHGGGPLAEEARWGKIQALHAMGRTEARDAAIASLEKASAGSVYLGKARKLQSEDDATP